MCHWTGSRDGRCLSAFPGLLLRSGSLVRSSGGGYAVTLSQRREKDRHSAVGRARADRAWVCAERILRDKNDFRRAGVAPCSTEGSLIRGALAWARQPW